MASVLDALVVDLSNYDWDTFDAQAFYAAGVRRAIVGSQRPSLSGQMVDALRSEGIDVIATYDLPYFGSDETTRDPVQRAVAFADQYRIPFVWVDAEIDANQTNVPEWKDVPTPSVAQRQAEFRWCMDLVRRSVPQHGIYTNGGWWTPNMGGSKEWCSEPLWLATYGKGGSAIDPITDVDFGGWTTAYMHQYTSTHTINGRGRDVSYLFGGANVEAQSAGGGLEARVAALETALRELSWAVFSGTEDKGDSDTARTTNVAYRIDQRLGRASDGTTMNSVADTALAAVRAIERLSEAAGMDSGQVRSIVGDELSDMMDAAKRALGE